MRSGRGLGRCLRPGARRGHNRDQQAHGQQTKPKQLPHDRKLPHPPPLPTVAGKERTDWPTQKPLALYEHFISASTNPGDMVLDPFCGCATTMVAAERLGRQWAGIDIDEVAVGITQKRLQDESDAAIHNVDLDGFREGLPSLHLPPRPPIRTDPERPKRSRNIRQILWAALGTGETRPCPGCDRSKYYDDFDLEHIIPKGRGGNRRRREPPTVMRCLQQQKRREAHDGRIEKRNVS
ncbi:MAG: site-specific DNA-methyltransferase [bacterium]|nr:site-specific DNA-methyltransferase [bacterium]MDE0118027.1 site-specific DNA-methyltransferase [bacterium]